MFCHEVLSDFNCFQESCTSTNFYQWIWLWKVFHSFIVLLQWIFLCRNFNWVCGCHYQWVCWRERWVRLLCHNKSPCSCLTGAVSFTQIWDCSVDTELSVSNDCGETVSIVSPSAQKRMDNFPSLLLLSVPRENALVARKNWVSAFSEFDHQFSDSIPFSSLSLFVEYHFVSDPNPRNDQRLAGNLFAIRDTSAELAIHSVSSSYRHMMSLNIDMKIIIQISRTSALKWDFLLQFWWNVNCLSNSFPWIQMLPNEEDTNIHRIIERLSMSCIEFSGERFSIFRNRSFTVFKNERDFREKSDFAAVSESFSISMTNSLDTSFTVLVFDISPCCTWEDHLGVWWVCQRSGFPRTCFAAYLTSSEEHSDVQIWCSPGFQLQSRQARPDPLHGISSPVSSWVLFDIVSRLLMELKWQMLKKHKRWFHSSRVKFPFVSMSANWFLVFDLHLGVQIDSIKKPIKSNSVGSGKHVSFSDFSPLWSAWSLLRCPQTHITRLPDAKTGRLREHNPYYSKLQSFQEFSFVLEI